MKSLHSQTRGASALIRHKFLLAIIAMIAFCNFSKAQTGAALNFDGVDDYVSLANFAINGSSARTVEFWLKTTNTGSFQTPFASGSPANGEAFNVKVTQDGHLGLMGFFTDYYPTTGTIIADGTFHHIAITYDGTNAMGYVDGVLEWTAPLALNTTGTNNYLGFSNHVGFEQPFVGTLDEVRIWTVARTVTEIQSSMNCTVDQESPGLLAYYTFNGGIPSGVNVTNTTLHDVTGHANNGTLMNFSLNGASSNFVTDERSNYLALHSSIGSLSNADRLGYGTAADFDGDGSNDLLTVDDNNNIRLYLNDGKGNFSTYSQITTGIAGRISAADVDGDGDIDFAVASNLSNVKIYINNGSGAFTPMTVTMNGTGTASVPKLADLNNDGMLDLIIGNNAFVAGSNSEVWLNTGSVGNASFTFAAGLNNNTFGPRNSISVGDVDGDGDIDILTGSYSYPSTLFLNSGNTGSFTQGTMPGGYSLLVELADWDHDGDLDAMIYDNYNNYGLRVSKNDGAGNFSTLTLATPLLQSVSSNQCYLKDLNGDGYLDAVLGNWGGKGKIYLNTGCTLVLQTACEYNLGYSDNGNAVADFNGDTKPDIFCLARNHMSTLYMNYLTPVTPPVPVSGTTVVTNVACFGGATGAINLTPSGGTPGYTFNWLPSGPTTEDRTALAAGTYSVIITDANGCTGTVNATVTQPTAPVSGTLVVTNLACFGGTTGAINLTPTGGTPGYIFNWGSGITTEDMSGLSAGNYTVTITDANGCTGTATASLTQPTSPVSGSTVATNISCFGAGNGSINLTPAGGTPGYTFDWGSGVTTEDISGLSAGNYTVTITDANGCTGTATDVVATPAALTATKSFTPSACTSSTGTASVVPAGGTSPYTFAWSSSANTTANETNLAPGTYSCIITDAHGCSITKNFMITTASGPVVSSTSQTDVSCNGGANGDATVFAGGGTGSYNYSWAPSGGTASTATGLSAGNYTVTVTDANGCSAVGAFSITQPLAITGSQTLTVCAGGSVTVGTTVHNASGTFTDVIAAFNGCDSTVTTNLTVLPSNATTQTLTVCAGDSVTVGTAVHNASGTFTDVIAAFNGCDSTVTTNLTVLPANATTQMLTVCAGGSVTIGTAVHNMSGTFTDILTAFNGCDSTVTTNLTVLPANTTTQTLTVCAGGSVTVGAAVHNISGTFTDILTAFNSCDSTVTTNLTVLPANTTTQTLTVCSGGSVTVGTTVHNMSGTFTDILTAFSGCDSTVTTNLTVLMPLSGTQNITICAGGSVTVGVNTYTLAGTYTDVLLSPQGCDSTVTTNLTVNTIDVTTSQLGWTLSANQGSAAYAWLDCDNASAAISGETSQSFNVTATGNYAVEITSNGCVDTSACVFVIIEGVEQNDEANTFTFYPNPASLSVMVDLKGLMFTSENKINVYNSIGKIVYSSRVTSEKMEISLSDFANGIYLVNVETSNGVMVKRLIKN